MPNTRKKVIKTVYKDEESEGEAGDFSDSGSEAQISEPPSSDEEDIEEHISSGEDFNNKPNKSRQKKQVKRKTTFAKDFINKVNRQINTETEENDIVLSQFSVKDLTDEDKLLPSVLNLSESDSSDDEAPKTSRKKAASIPYTVPEEKDSENDGPGEYTDVWSTNMSDNSAEIAKKAFMELEKHKTTLEETKASIQNYVPRSSIEQTKESNVTDLLAQGEEAIPQKIAVKAKRKGRKIKDDSDSEVEDWEEVKESKAIPQQGIQLVVALPDSVCRKSKKIDVEMMMKKRMNRVKKEHQVFMHKVHVLSWIGHGNYVSPVLNDQEIMSAVLAMVPKGCYPDSRLDMKYLEQITKWYKDKINIKQDKNENKFKPKAPPLRIILLEQIKNRSVTAKKFMVFIFVAMLRALGLQCRIMFNFVTVPLRPPNSELHSLSTKSKDDKGVEGNKKDEKPKAVKRKSTESKPKYKGKLPQVDGNYDSCSSSDAEFELSLNCENYPSHHVLWESSDPDENYDQSENEFENIMQVDGNDDTSTGKSRPVRSTRSKKVEVLKTDDTENIRVTSDAKSRSMRSTGTKKAEVVKSNAKNEGIIYKSQPKRSISPKKAEILNTNESENEGVSPPKQPKKDDGAVKSKLESKKPVKAPQNKTNNKGEGETQIEINSQKNVSSKIAKSPKNLSLKNPVADDKESNNTKTDNPTHVKAIPRKTRSNNTQDSNSTTNSIKTHNSPSESQVKAKTSKMNTSINQAKKTLNPPKIILNDEKVMTQSKYFEPVKEGNKRTTRKRSHTTIVDIGNQSNLKPEDTKTKTRTKSAPGSIIEKSKYFDSKSNSKKPKLSMQQLKKQEKLEDAQRVSHKDLLKPNTKPKNDVTGELVNIIKGRIKDAKEETKKKLVKGKVKKEESDDDSDFLPVEDPKQGNSSDEEFKPTKVNPRGHKLSPGTKPSTSKKQIDRRVLSSDEDTTKISGNKGDVWCEVFVEDLEQWIAVDVVNGKLHCTGELYKHATHPVNYTIGWDNNNYMKDLTRRYVPHWNTVTRKQRVESEWWQTAVQPWVGPRNARDKEEDEALDRMQLEAPLPSSIGEYKNHPLYALKRHLLKFEALYPPDAQVLGFVRKEPVYARECVYVCRSRDIWLKEAKVVRMGEKPYKVVTARPKWDRLSNKLIKDRPLEVFGPWQVQDYEPPTAENGIVPRNAYGNVELFKECMLPKGTVHVKLPGLNKVCRKLNIDCAPAMTGFDYSGGYAHPAYDGFVVCKEFEEIVTEAWVKDQEEQERKEIEKLELRVYGNWKRFIKGLLIRERLKYKYGFEEPTTSQAKKKGPRFVAKKN